LLDPATNRGLVDTHALTDLCSRQSLIIRTTSSFRLMSNCRRCFVIDFSSGNGVSHLSRCLHKLDHYTRPAKPLLCKVGTHLKAAFTASQQSYGSRRLVSALAAHGIDIGRYKVRSLMRRAGLEPVWKRKFIHTTDSNHTLPIAENILARQFNPVAPNTAFVTDITYIRTVTGWLYLAMVLDLFSRKVVGWAMAPSMPAELVCEALRMAIAQRRPATGLIVHSDRGSQYASKQYQALLAEHGFICSMSRRANCWDNAVAERFFLNLKMERVWQRTYANQAEAKNDVTDYIVGFYNCTRLHSVLGNLSPSVFERKMAAKKPIAVS
jgi:putative transposase